MNPQTLLQKSEALELLKKRVENFRQGYRQNIAILADEFVGKSTLVKQFSAELKDPSVVLIYVEILPFEFQIFCKRFISSLLYNFLKNSQLISSREELDILVKRSCEAIPKTAQLIESLLARLEKEKSEILFKELFTIASTFNQESEKRCIIICDEFQNLKKLGIKNICQELGKRIMFEKNSLFVFTSSFKNEANDILGNDLSLLFGNFEIIELAMLNPKSCSTFIKNLFAEYHIPENLISFIINFTGGHPFYLRTICQEALRECKIHQRFSLEKETLILTLERMLFNDTGIFNVKFTTLLERLSAGRNKNDFIYLLDALAIGKNRLKDLAPHLRRQKKEITQKLNRLIELDIAIKNGSFYSISDRMLAFWLKFVHYEKFNSLEPLYEQQAINFRNKLDSEIENFIDTSKKDIASRIMDLFNNFEGDDIMLDRKKFRLSTFKELKILNLDFPDLKIGVYGKSNDSLWLAAIKENGLNETDVNNFLQLTKKFANKTIIKLMISLGDIDRNAKLLAKESRISTLDTNSVNSLLDLYNKPRIIKQ